MCTKGAILCVLQGMIRDQICIDGSVLFYSLIRRNLKLYCLSCQMIIFSFSTHKINFSTYSQWFLGLKKAEIIHNHIKIEDFLNNMYFTFLQRTKIYLHPLSFFFFPSSKVYLEVNSILIYLIRHRFILNLEVSSTIF